MRIQIHLQDAKLGSRKYGGYDIRRRFLVKTVTLAPIRMGVRPFFFNSLAQLFEKGCFCWRR